MQAEPTCHVDGRPFGRTGFLCRALAQLMSACGTALQTILLLFRAPSADVGSDPGTPTALWLSE